MCKSLELAISAVVLYPTMASDDIGDMHLEETRLACAGCKEHLELAFGERCGGP